MDVKEKIWNNNELRHETPKLRMVSRDWAREVWNNRQELTVASVGQLDAIFGKWPARLKSLQLKESFTFMGEVASLLSDLVSRACTPVLLPIVTICPFNPRPIATPTPTPTPTPVSDSLSWASM